MKKMNKKGFTIVELVIVIAVIAILAAVLIPTFTIVVKKAKDSNALSAARDAVTKVSAEIATVDSIENGTIFAVADKKGAVAKHFIAYDSTKEENLAQVATDKAAVTFPTVAADTYLVFAKTKEAAKKIMDDVVGESITFGADVVDDEDTVIAAGSIATDYVNGYFIKGTGTTKTVKLFLAEDMPEVAVAILKITA